MLSANVMSLYILGQEEGGEVRGRGSRQHWCWDDVNFGAVRNLHSKQEQIDDSFKQKSAVWPADNWKLVRGREPVCIPRGSRGWQIEFF